MPLTYFVAQGRVSQYRRSEGLTLIHSEKLFKQFIVNAYICIEQARLKWISKHQRDLGTDLYRNIQYAV
jgi:hypothetical protein